MAFCFRRIRMDFNFAVGRSLGAAITISADSAGASDPPYGSLFVRSTVGGRPKVAPTAMGAAQRHHPAWQRSHKAQTPEGVLRGFVLLGDEMGGEKKERKREKREMRKR